MSNEADHGGSSKSKSPRDTITINNKGDTLPVVEVLTGRGIILGKSGSGKSNSASIIVEELLDDGYPVLIIDVDGEYFGLKEEYELLHLGADEECDLCVGPEHAEKIAELTLEQNIPVVLDVSGFLREEEQKELIKEVGRYLFAKEKKLKKPFLMLVEEVHEYIPESGLDDTGQMLIKIAKRGRKHGLGLCGISQRPADVKKSFITQCDWHVWHRLTWDNDTNVVRRVLGSEYADAVQTLNDGEAFLLTDWDDLIERVHFRRKHTFDAGATPGLEDIEPPDLKSVSENILSELETISESQRSEASETERLQSELEEREERINQLEEKLEKARDVSGLAERFADALVQREADSTSVQESEDAIEEISQKKNQNMRSVLHENQRLRDENGNLRERVEELEKIAKNAERLESTARDTEPTSYNKNSGRLDEHVETFQEANSEYYKQSEPGVEANVPTYRKFLEEDAVKNAVAAAKKEATSPRYVKGVILTVIAKNRPVTYDEIADELDISSTGHVASAVNALHKRNIITKSKNGRLTNVDLNIDDLNEIRATAQRRATSRELMSEI